MLASLFGTGGVGIDYPITVGVTLGIDCALFNQYQAAGRAFFTLGKSALRAGGLNGAEYDRRGMLT